MTPDRLRLLLRDLGCGAAFASMAISGQVPAWASALFAAGLLVAAFDLRIFAERSTISAVVLAGGALALYANVAAMRLDLVVAACTFAGLLACQRMLSEPTQKTDHQVHLTSLLMIAGGAALSGDLLFLPCLVLFAVLASISLGMSVVEGARTGGEILPTRPLLRVLSGGVFIALLGGMVFFVLVPRLSWSLAARRTGIGLGTPSVGFSDRVQIGGSGRLKTNPRIVLRATLTPDPQKESLGAYWIGHRFDHFDGLEWSSGKRRRTAEYEVHLMHGGQGLISQQIELLPAYATPTLVGMDRPIQFGAAVAELPTRNVRTRLINVPEDEVRFEMDAPAYTYQVFSRPEAARDAVWTEEEQARALELPARLDPRVKALALEIVGDQTTPEARMDRLERYLSSTYAYTLELPGAVADPLTDFLFVRRAGHCEHFATALAIMLRTLGIPARVVAGFYGGARSGGHYVVRAGDAHAWVEAYVPGRGVRRLDATPPAGRSGQLNVVLDWLMTGYERLETAWDAKVLDYSFRDQAEFAQKIIGPRERTPLTSPEGIGRPLRLRLLGLGVLALIGYAIWRLVRTGFRSPTGEATALLIDAERLLRAEGELPDPKESAAPNLEQLGEALSTRKSPLGPAVARVARRYNEARFGRRPLGHGERQALRAHLQQAIRRSKAS